jgi:hypothetical protein
MEGILRCGAIHGFQLRGGDEVDLWKVRLIYGRERTVKAEQQDVVMMVVLNEDGGGTGKKIKENQEKREEGSKEEMKRGRGERKRQSLSLLLGKVM